VAFRKKLSREKVLRFFAEQPRCIVAMEACGSAHHWGRAIRDLGHEVRLIPPIYVKPFVKRQKNDAADSEAIAEAASRPTMRFVTVKTEEQQARAMLFRTRDLFVRQRTQLINALRGHLSEYGVVAAQAQVQTCIVHLLRHSLDFVSYKDRKAVAAALKTIYRANNADDGEAALSTFEASEWGRKYPAIGQSWRRAWTEVVPFYAFHPDVRRLIYTTNAIEALNSKLRRAVRARGHFPTDEAATKLLFLVLNKSEKEWTMPAREWSIAKAQFAILFGERFTKAMN
jgi:Transposase, Mutator family/Transposase